MPSWAPSPDCQPSKTLACSCSCEHTECFCARGFCGTSSVSQKPVCHSAAGASLVDTPKGNLALALQGHLEQLGSGFFSNEAEMFRRKFFTKLVEVLWCVTPKLVTSFEPDLGQAGTSVRTAVEALQDLYGFHTPKEGSKAPLDGMKENLDAAIKACSTELTLRHTACSSCLSLTSLWPQRSKRVHRLLWWQLQLRNPTPACTSIASAIRPSCSCVW
jgi:hypothetical protein